MKTATFTAYNVSPDFTFTKIGSTEATNKKEAIEILTATYGPFNCIRRNTGCFIRLDR